jgi:hypothetical protein
MAYQPTGRPPGRPRKNPEPEVTDLDPRPCTTCWPGDQGLGVYTASCPHDTYWVNPVLTSGRCVAK